MDTLTRRKVITTGIAAGIAGTAGVGAAVRIGKRHGLIAPDCRGPYGAGEALDLWGRTGAGRALAGAGVSAEHDLEGAVRE